ncbi:MAG: aminotransferase class IV [Bacteroidota bacterium]
MDTNLMGKKYCYYRGSVIEESKASLPLDGIGTLRGFGVFDFFRMRNGAFCFLEDHLTRFERSQKFLGLSDVIGKDEIRDALDTLTGWNQLPESGLRMVVLGEGLETDHKLSPLFYILQTDLSKHRPLPFASVITHEYHREYPLIKSNNYFTSNLLHRKRMMAGALDVIYYKDGVVSEASRSNIFLVKGNRLITPKKNVLPGVTRSKILALASDVLEVSEAPISLTDLMEADEVFLTSTLKEVCPIVEIDAQRVGKGSVGVNTRKIAQKFREHVYGLSNSSFTL